MDYYENPITEWYTAFCSVHPVEINSWQQRSKNLGKTDIKVFWV